MIDDYVHEALLKYWISMKMSQGLGRHREREYTCMRHA